MHVSTSFTSPFECLHATPIRYSSTLPWLHTLWCITTQLHTEMWIYIAAICFLLSLKSLSKGANKIIGERFCDIHHMQYYVLFQYETAVEGL